MVRCTVSGTKFNIEKTEVIPIGATVHQEEVLTSRKVNPNDSNQLDA